MRLRAFATIAAVLAFHPAQAQVVRQITHHFHGGYQLGVGALDDAGAAVFAAYNEDPLGTNPQHAWQLFKWTAAGAATQLTAALEGSSSVSVSDDGQWLAFISRADLVGQNHDESAELYVMRSDGSQLVQRTSDPAPNAGDVLSAQIAGSGNRIVFSANTDPLGSNLNHLIQLFGVNRDGSGLAQLTSLTEFNALRFTPRIAVSDDGQRFLYTIQEFEGVAISGAGNRIARVSQYGFLSSENWDGTGTVQLDSGVGSIVSLNDTGSFVYYAAYDGDNYEIFQVRSNGSLPRIRLTNTQPPLSHRDVVVAGGGGRIAFTVTGGAYPGFSNPDGGLELMVMDSAGGNLHQLTSSPDSSWALLDAPDLTADGTRAAFHRYPNAISRIQTNGTDMTDLIHLVSEFEFADLSISSDGSQVAFGTYDDLTGQNPAGHAIFRVAADGSGVTQLTPQGFGFPSQPVIPPDSSMAVFYDGQTLYRVDLDGTNLQPLYTNSHPIGGPPRASVNAASVVHMSTFTTSGQTVPQVFRYSTATGGQFLTSDLLYGSWYPDISADGQCIVYSSSSDPLGTNPNHEGCLFLLEPEAGTLRQLTPAGVGGSGPQFSVDGRWIYFASADPLFEQVPGQPYEPYRVNVATGVIERVGGLRVRSGSLEYPVAPDATGAHAVYVGSVDPVLDNQDGDWELFFIDFSTAPKIRVSAATPTVVSWDVEPSPVRYDVIRGDVANLGFGAGSTVDLGTVACIENDSPDVDTVGDEDPIAPSPGQTFFYVHRGSQGILAGPGSYGQGTGGRERLAGAGGCSP